ncbi:MAG: hypothetical protein UT63_C0075G0002 [Candidatus Gottesmanbacteria bacterium GW2011_GWC2_39_8]|uniref:Lipoprotein n=1 Tax=Candidatus Gottesmanbacteria bacterium GW2011_GWC2_39_8 TaxID=1618450 RepID=A0A0G0PT06_9BACT|nr:MAG: hypothetical protein UT63_C0075G0002 [Candidatus Gottesmanbacteria bacterium GW2011_GWC2_39_8]
MAFKKNLIANLFLCAFVLFAFTACEIFRGFGGLSVLSTITEYNPPTSFKYKLSSKKASASAAHTLSFKFSGETLETYKIVLTYPAGFTFEGFGKTNAKIGFYKLISGKKTAANYAIRVIDSNHAYVDQNKSKTYDAAFEATIERLTDGLSGEVFTVILPNGGDGNAFINGGTFNGKMSVGLKKGILKNPSTGGESTVKADFTSVDPDTGGADNGTGESQKTFSVTKVLTIGKK